MAAGAVAKTCPAAPPSWHCPRRRRIQVMKRVAVWVLALSCLLTALCQTGRARASDCPAMTDYTYENGQCQDVSPDFYAPLQRSYQEEWRTQHDMFEDAKSWNRRV